MVDNGNGMSSNDAIARAVAESAANMGDMNSAYRKPGDPLDKRADPLLIYRDLPSTVVTDWNPDLVRAALRAHLIGQFQGTARLCEAVLNDGRIQATLGSRTSAVLSQPIRFDPAPNTGAAGRKACDAWTECWSHITAEEVLALTLRWGVMLGFSIGELLWDTGDIWAPRLKIWHPEYSWYNLVSRYFMAVTWDGMQEVKGGDGKWALYAPFGEYRGWVHGALRAVAAPWLARQYAAYRDWPRYSEVHGIPILKAIVPFDADQPQKQAFQDAVAEMGSESVVMVPQGDENRRYDVELLEAGADTWQAFQGLIESCDMSIVLAILGQNLTTEVKEGSFAAARVHGDVRQDLLERDARTLEHFIRSQIARPFALYNFGDADLAPITRWAVDPIEDKGVRAKTFVDLSAALKGFADVHVPVDVQRIARQFNLPLDAAAVANAPEPDVIFSSSDVAAGIVTADEARAAMGLSPLPKPEPAQGPQTPGPESKDDAKGTNKDPQPSSEPLPSRAP